MESTEDNEIPLEWCQENPDTKVDEVDSLSTNHYDQMDRENEEMEEEEEQSIASCDEPLQLNEELQAGYKILCDLMADSKKAVNWPFMESIEVSAPDLFEDYRKRIEKPMWLKLMKQNFEEHLYNSITEFVTDFRIMLENCYRFNGPDHYVSKRGQKLETMLEQKLVLLSRDMREKTSIEATSGHKADDSASGMGLRRRPKSHLHHDSTVLLSQLREEEQQKVREYRRQMIMDRKAEKEALVQEIIGWEDTVLFGGQKDQMKAMWEIPQIGLFFFLCQGPLNIGEVMHFELERSFLMPRESSTMQLVMTTLLSTPFQRLKIDKKTLMPYKVWEQKLRYKLQNWYKVFTDSAFDVEKTCSKLGLVEQFFTIVGKKNPLEKKKYHELSFYKRVWITKSLCDHCLFSQESLREVIELQPYLDQREYMLGTDADGQRYIHFPQFCGADVRIYRQAPIKYPKIEIKPDPFDSKRKFPLVYKPPPAKKIKLKKKKKNMKKTDKASPFSSPVRQRPSRLRQTIKTVVPLQLGLTSSESEDSDDVSDMDTNNDTNTEVEDEPCDKDDEEIDETDKNDLNDNKSEDRLSSGSDASTIPYCDKSDTNSSAMSSRDCSRESSPYPTPTDLRPRRSTRLDKLSDCSREASPLIFDSDFGLRRSGRSKTRLKNIPPLRATRNLTNILLDENSTSNSSAFGENSNSGFWRDRLLLNENSRSSDTEEESNGCDINNLFSNVKSADNDLAESSSRLKDLSASECNEVKSMARTKNSPNCTDNETEVDGFDKERESNKADEMDVGKTSDSHQQVLCNGIVGEKDKNIVKIAGKETDTAKGTCEAIQVLKNVPNGDSRGEVRDKDASMDVVQTETGEEQVIAKGNHVQTGIGTGVNSAVENGKSSADENGDNSAVERELGDDEDMTVNDTGKSNVDICRVANTNLTVTGESGSNIINPDISINEQRMENGSLIKENTNSATETINDTGELKSQKEVNCETKSHSLDNRIKTEEEPKYQGELKTEDEIKKEQVDINTIEKEVDIENVKDNTDLSDKTSTVYKDEENEMLPNIKTEPSATMSEDNASNLEIKKETRDAIKSNIDEKKVEIKKEESEEEEEEEEKSPDMSEFELLADSVEGLRRLTAEFAEQEPIVLRRGKKEQVMKPPPRKKCVVILHERLEYLLKELEPWESKLQQATKRARIRLRKEFEDYVEPPADEDDKWNTTDEETESGASGDDDNTVEGDVKDDSKKTKPNLNTGRVFKDTNSRCSTPIKIEEPDEIDVSQRGRLRKRRIIPNNIEDQFGPKKMKSIVKTEPPQSPSASQDAHSSNQPIIIQSGKSQLVDYADILRQLKNANTGGSAGPSPILIRTSQGGRTVLTSVMPVVASSTTAPAGIQGLRFIAPATMSTQLISQHQQQQQVQISIPTVVGGSGVTRANQHPTIQNLLANHGVVLPHSSASQLVQILPQVSNKGASTSVVSVQQSSVASIRPQTPIKSHTQSQPGFLHRQTTPQKVVLHSQTTPQKIVLDQPTTTPQKIAPHTVASEMASAGKVKYYAANASTLPINVVQQLLATRGAKLQTGPNQQSILYIPMESEGQSRNVAAVGKNTTTLINPQFLSPVKTSPDSQDHLKIDTSAWSNQTTPLKSPSATVATSSSLTQISKTVTGFTTNTPILPKPQPCGTTSPVFNVTLASGLQGIQIQPSLQPLNQSCVLQDQSGNLVASVAKTLKPVIQNRFPTGSVALGVSKSYLPPTSPPRYPTNETVRTLLDKRKSVDDKSGPALKRAPDDKLFPPTTYPCIASQLQGIGPKPMNSSVILKSIPANQIVETRPQAIGVVHEMERKDNHFSLGNPLQQCVITSISQAKLNTLLLQTTAAGAKTIPSLIKLPSKALLDSAVKAVVTSVNTTLPTVNIKVPSPTSLPSIAPRRNVTKTIQTMRSPIPVAPKIITHGSGLATLSIADSQGVGTRSDPVTSMRGLSNVSIPTSVTQSQVTAIVQNIDGKKVLTKVAPQTFLTSKGMVQMGYLNPQGMVLQKAQPAAGTRSPTAPLTVKQEDIGNQALMGMQLVQNSAGQLQLVHKSSQQLQQSSQKTTTFHQGGQQTNISTAQIQSPVMQSSVKPVVALHSSGNIVGVAQVAQVKPTPQHRLPSSPSPTAILPKTTSMFTATPLKSPVMGVASTKSPTLNRATSLKSPLPGTSFMLPQSFSGVLNPAQSGVVNQSPASPLLNMQQGLLLPGGGIQLARPVMSPLGLNLLQTGVALQSPTILQSSQNVNILQNSINTAALKQMVNINPMMVSQGIASNPNVVLGQNPLNVCTMRPTAVGQQASAYFPASISPAQMSGSSMMLPGKANSVASRIATTSTGNQLVFQYAVPSQNIAVTNTVQSPGLPMHTAVKNLSSTFAFGHQGMSKTQPGLNSKPGDRQPTPQFPSPQGQDNVVAMSPAVKPIQSETNIMPTRVAFPSSTGVKSQEQSTGQKTNPAHQKLLLFSIGGQLVTGQGVPVTLSDGVLKLMPRQKIQVANQMLSREQIQQTLAKINQAAVSGLNVASNLNQQGPSQAANQNTGIQQTNVANQTVPNKLVVQAQGHNPVQDHAYQHKDKIQKQLTPQLDGIRTVYISQSGSQFSSDISQTTQNSNTTVAQLGKLEKTFEIVSTTGSAGVPVYVKPRSHNSQYVMKPMVYSSGFIVCPRTSEDTKSVPVVTDVNSLSESKQAFDKSKFMAEKEGFIVKAPVKPGVNGQDAFRTANVSQSSSSTHLAVQKTENKIKAETNRGYHYDDSEENNLVIDDCTTEKEAALNLLRLANQGLAPMSIKVEKEIDNSGDAHSDNDFR